MKYFVLFISYSILLVSCSENAGIASDIVQIDVELQDSSSTVQDSLDTIPLQISAFDSLMENPIDIIEFKKTKISSNSGGGTKMNCFYKPNAEGLYYDYFLFYKKPPGVSESQMFNQLTLTVYKLGEIGHYEDTNEILISVQSSLADPDLGKLDLVGKSPDEVLAIFNGPNLKKDGKLIIYSRNNVIVLDIFAGRVRSFRYAKLNFEMTNGNDLPEELN